MTGTGPVVLVTGGRDYTDKLAVAVALGRIAPAVVVQGGARGADQFAREWALAAGGSWLVEVPARWGDHGRSAGPQRNAWMLDLALRLVARPADLIVLAFPGERGTENMVALAMKVGADVRRVTDPPPPPPRRAP